MDGPIPAAQLGIGLGGLAALGFIAWRGARCGAVAWLGPLWLSITLGPVLVPLADKGLFGERYLYLGMLGSVSRCHWPSVRPCGVGRCFCCRASC